MNRSLFFAGLFALVFSSLGAHAASFPRSPSIAVVELDGALNPLSAHFIDSAISAAERSGARLLVINAAVDKGYSSSVGAVAESIRLARIPVFVRSRSAHGASPESALAYLVQAAGGRAESRNPAVAPGLFGPAESLPKFIRGLDGAKVIFHGAPIELRIAGLPIRTYRMNGIARLLAPLLDPNLAYVLLLLGIIGIAVEFSLPGIGAPGILGGLSLLTSLTAFGALSVSVGGLLIILLALVLFVVDIKAPTHGALTAGGIVALIAGSFFLFPARQALPGLPLLRVSPVAIGVMTAVLSTILISAVFIGARAQGMKVTVGSQTLVGLSGIALTEVNPEGLIRVGNEEWSARSVGDEIKAGDEVDVVDVEGVHLIIMRRL